MSDPQFPDPLGLRQVDRPGSRASIVGLDPPRRLDALEQGAMSRPGPGVTNGSVPVANSAAIGGAEWVDRGTTDTTQTGVSFSTGWANIGVGYATVRYRRINGYLYINGACAKTNTVGSSKTMFNLPAGFRPAADHIVTCIPVVAGALNDAHIYVKSGGDVTVEEAGIGATTVVNYVPINVCIPLA